MLRDRGDLALSELGLAVDLVTERSGSDPKHCRQRRESLAGKNHSAFKHTGVNVRTSFLLTFRKP